MMDVIEVRLPDGRTDEYVDVYPDDDSSRVYGIIRHRYEVAVDGSLSVVRVTLSANFSLWTRYYSDFQTQDSRVVGTYPPGHYTSVRETQRETPRDPW